MLVDRYGGLKNGEYLSTIGTPMTARSLPEHSRTAEYYVFRVMKPFKVEAGDAAPAFGQFGMGPQFRTSEKIQQLINDGFLKEITR